MGEEQWNYQFGAGENKIGANILRLKTAMNGDIIGGGWWFDSTDEVYDFFLDRVPFIFRMSKDGELIWQKAIVEQDTLLFERAVAGVVNDLIELENGDIMAVGRWGLPDRKKIVIRIDSDGCIKEQCGDHFTVTDVDELTLPLEIRLSPNPVKGGEFYIQGLSRSESYRYTIFDQNANNVKSGELNITNPTVSIEDLALATYFIRIYDEKFRSKTLKFVKI